MIAFVNGKLVEKRPAEAIVEVNGVGFNLLIPTSTYERLPIPAKNVMLLTYLHVREDALLLFGFSTDAERALFRLMISVAGVGPKLALAALSAMSPEELSQSIASGSNKALVRIPGIGRKTADRLIIELRDRMDTLVLDDADTKGNQTALERADALAALEALGLTRVAAERRLRKVQRKNPDVTSASDLIRLALQE